MKKIIKTLTVLSLISIIFTSCAKQKTFTINKEKVVVHPYGWANEPLRNDSISYQVNAANVVIGIITIETIVVPVYLTGWEFFEPVEKKKK